LSLTAESRHCEFRRGITTPIVVLPNITIVALPPKSPELNPVENVWQYIRDNWLANGIKRVQQ
jgi:transposase